MIDRRPAVLSLYIAFDYLSDSAGVLEMVFCCFGEIEMLEEEVETNWRFRGGGRREGDRGESIARCSTVTGGAARGSSPASGAAAACITSVPEFSIEWLLEITHSHSHRLVN